jgi:acetyltransferase-like isoleucine patch superfamily enzyme
MSLKNRVLRRLAVRSGVRVGARFHVGPRSVIWAPTSLAIGNDVYIGKHVTIEVDGSIGDGTLIANNVGIVGRRDHDHRQIGSPVRLSDWVGDHPGRLSDPVCIGSDVWLGFGAIVLSGVSVGDSCVIAAGAVVINDVPANSVVAGNPGAVIAQRFARDELATHWQLLRSKGVRLMVDITGVTP